jgi:hypothetical protein
MRYLLALTLAACSAEESACDQFFAVGYDHGYDLGSRCLPMDAWDTETTCASSALPDGACEDCHDDGLSEGFADALALCR